ncbi:MAG: dTMP kinase [Candidatus Aminicenantes bacterium]|nr:dTMP kinase [Candidatus Aminicenantes bacterium]
MKIQKPSLIVFEGIDGSGKTSVSKLLLSYLQDSGNEVQWFREPADSRWGRKIRELANLKESIPIEEELEYFIKDRQWNVKNNILPGLRQNKTVILDRYYFSTACYQGARGFSIEEIIERNTAFAPAPDITFIIDVDVDTALKRIKRGRDYEAKLFEKRDFLQKVRANYLELRAPGIHIIDGTPPLDEVFDRVRNKIDSF